MSSRGGAWALLLPFSCVLIQGVHTVVSKMSAGVISPETISFYRWVVAIAVLAPFLTGGFRQEWPVVRRHLGRIFILAVLGMVSYQALVYVAAKTTTATNIAIIGALIPMVSVILSALLLRYRPTLLVIIGCVISLAGALVLVQKGNPASVFDHAPEIADIYLLIGVLLYALYGVLLRRWNLPISVPALLFAQALMALVITAPGPVIGTATPLDAYNGTLVLLAGILGSAVAPFLWMKSVQTVGPVASGIFVNFAPLVTAGIAVTFLGETVEPYHWAGGALIVGGVLLAQIQNFRADAKS